jgi:hypothetical protein
MRVKLQVKYEVKVGCVPLFPFHLHLVRRVGVQVLLLSLQDPAKPFQRLAKLF